MKLHFVPLGVIAICLGPAVCFAQTPSAPSTSGPNPPAKMSDALKIASPPDPSQLVFAINTDWISPPKDASPLSDHPDFPEIAADYGMQVVTFGDVNAIAPMNMTVLNAPPSEPDIYANIPTYEAFTLLVASLTDLQYSEITSDSGIALTDLNTPWQKKLLTSLLSKGGTLHITPHYTPGDPYSASADLDETSQISQTHMRIGLTTMLQLPIKGQTSYYGGQWIPPVDNSRPYEVSDREDYGGSSSVAYGAQVKSDVPNILKSSQLDYTMPALQMQIPLAGLKSVGDVLALISSMTHIEIYADKRLDQGIQTLGTVPSAKASDLLQAIAICQMGTYRQVGSLYILTDDVEGVGSRKLEWAEFDKIASNLRQGPVQKAADLNGVNHVVSTIPWLNDEGKFSADQINQPGDNGVSNGNGLPSFSTTFDKLTLGQQAMAKREVDNWAQESKGNPYEQPISTDGNIMVDPAVDVQLIIPGIPDPVEVGVNGQGAIQTEMVFQPPSTPQQPPANYTPPKDFVANPSEDMIALAADNILKSATQKAVISHARTAVGVDADIAAMKQLGLTQMWLDVFSDGQAHIPGSPLSVGLLVKPGQNDILTEAIAKGKAAGISVYAVMDLFYWGSNVPEGLADVNIFGETSTQEQARWEQRNALLPNGAQPQEFFTTGSIVPIFPGVAVAQSDATARQELLNLTSLVRSHNPNGIVLRDTDPPGYDLGSNTLADEQSPDFELGYVPSAREAFIRKNHIDPIDLYPVGTWMGVANTDMPNFSDNNGWTSGLTSDGLKAWGPFRRSINLELLRQIYATAEPINPSAKQNFVVLVKQRRKGQTFTFDTGGVQDTDFGPGWYGSWDNVIGEPPTIHGYEDADPTVPNFQQAPDDAQAKAQSQIVFTPYRYSDIERSAHWSHDLIAKMSAIVVKNLAPKGIVLDLSGDPFGDNGNGSDPITNMASIVAKAKLN